MAKSTAASNCRACSHWKEIRDRMKIAELLGKAMENFEKGVKFNPTLSEYLKLVQLEKEFAEEEIREIRVSWVEPGEKSKGR